MKHINIKSGLILGSLLVSFILTSCQKEEDYMKANVVDMNIKITAVDKVIAQPGDVVTFSGMDLDKVYKVMLNTENIPISYTATATELKMTVPSTAPLGDVITINLLFSGKGLAQRAIKIISPPVIFAFSPVAAHPGDIITVYGKELQLYQTVKIGSVDVTSSLVLQSDKIFTVKVPDGSTGGIVSVITATGGVSDSPYPMLHGTELMINDYDGNHHYDNGISSNGNLDLDVQETGDFPRNNFWTFTFKDNATSWGGNVDFYTTGLPVGTYLDKSIISLSVDIKLSKALSVNVMIAKSDLVWGKTISLVAGWQTVVLPFSEMGSGYGSTPSADPTFLALPLFSDITGIKIQPPVSASNANFGETISVDNIKFFIAN